MDYFLGMKIKVIKKATPKKSKQHQNQMMAVEQRFKYVADEESNTDVISSLGRNRSVRIWRFLPSQRLCKLKFQYEISSCMKGYYQCT